MTKLQLLHRALNERLMAAVEQIMEMVGGTVLEYEEETVRARKENELLRRRLRWMEGENPTDWSDPTAFSVPDEARLTDTLALESLIIKTEPIDTDFQLYGRDTSRTASVCTASVETTYPGTSAPADAGIPDGMVWDTAQSYMAPLDFDPTLSTMARNRNQRRSFACPDCGKVFGREQRLMFHMRVHSTERPYTYRRRKTCFYGDKKRKKKLRGLTKTSREFIEDLSDTSEQTEQSTGSANVGISGSAGPSAPEAEPSEASDEASEHTSSSKLSETSAAARPVGLKAKQGKEKAKTAQCLQCNKAFTNLSRLAVHMKTHRKPLSTQDEENVQGDTDRTDSGSQHLPKVIRNNETEVEKAKAIGQRLFQCPECKKIFARSCWLTFHLKSHEQERKRQKKKQLQNNNLKDAPQVSEEQKKEVAPESSKVQALKKIFACPYCDKVFAREGWLGPHIRSHTIKKQKSDILSEAILPNTTKRRTRRVIAQPSTEGNKEEMKNTEQSLDETENSETVDEQANSETSVSQSITVELTTNPETQTVISNNSEDVTNEAESISNETETVANKITEESSPVPEESSGPKGEVKKSKKRFPCRECGKVYLLAGWLKTHKKMHKKERLQEENKRRLMMMKELGLNDNKEEGQSLTETNIVKKKQKKKKKSLGQQESFDDKKKKKNQLTNAVLLKAMTAADKSKEPGEATRGQCVCKDCGKVYARKNWLSLHMLGHRKALMALPQKANDEARKSDGKATQEGSSTEDPKGQKGKEGGKASFPCPFCDKVFPRAMRLMVHMQIHSGEKPYSYRQRKEQFYSDPTRPRVPDTDKKEPAVEGNDEKGKDGGIEVTRSQSSAVSQGHASTTDPMETFQPQSVCSGRKFNLLPLQSSGAATVHSTTLTRTDSKSDSNFSLQPRIVLDPVIAESSQATSSEGGDFKPVNVESSDIQLHQMPDLSETKYTATGEQVKSHLAQNPLENSSSFASQTTLAETDDPAIVCVKVGPVNKYHENNSCSEKPLVSIGEQQTSGSPEHRKSEISKRKGQVESCEDSLFDVQQHSVRRDPEPLEMDTESQQSKSPIHTHGKSRFLGTVKAKNIPPHSEYPKCGIDRACKSDKKSTDLALTTVPEFVSTESSSSAMHQVCHTQSGYMILSDVSDDDEWANVSNNPEEKKEKKTLKTSTPLPEGVADAGSIPNSSHKASDSDSDVTIMPEKTGEQNILDGTLTTRDETVATSVQQTEEPSSTRQKKWFTCLACGLTFAGEASLTQHMKVHSVSAGTYQKSNAFKTLKKRVKNNETKLKQDVVQVQTSEVGSGNSTDNNAISGKSDATLINVSATKLSARCPDIGATSRGSRADSKTLDRKTEKEKRTLHCCYCGKAYEKIELHLMHDHPEEPKVMEALHFSNTLEERKRLLSLLCSSEKLKQDYTTRNKKDTDLVHCIFCQGYYQQSQFWKHALICEQKRLTDPGSSTDLPNTSLRSRPGLTQKTFDPKSGNLILCDPVQQAIPESILQNHPLPKADHHTTHYLYSISPVSETGSSEINPVPDHGSLSIFHACKSSVLMNLDSKSSGPLLLDSSHSALECTSTSLQEPCSSTLQEALVENQILVCLPLRAKCVSEKEHQSTLEPENRLRNILQPHIPVLSSSYLLDTGSSSVHQNTDQDCQSSSTHVPPQDSVSSSDSQPTCNLKSDGTTIPTTVSADWEQNLGSGTEPERTAIMMPEHRSERFTKSNPHSESKNSLVANIVSSNAQKSAHSEKGNVSIPVSGNEGYRGPHTESQCHLIPNPIPNKKQQTTDPDTAKKQFDFEGQVRDDTEEGGKCSGLASDLNPLGLNSTTRVKRRLDSRSRDTKRRRPSDPLQQTSTEERKASPVISQTPETKCGLQISDGWKSLKNSKGKAKLKLKKNHYCVYCKKPSLRMTQHLLSAHAKEPEVAKALSYDKKSKERKQLLDLLQTKGNLLHKDVAMSIPEELLPTNQASSPSSNTSCTSKQENPTPEFVSTPFSGTFQSATQHHTDTESPSEDVGLVPQQLAYHESQSDLTPDTTVVRMDHVHKKPTCCSPACDQTETSKSEGKITDADQSTVDNRRRSSRIQARPMRIKDNPSDETESMSRRSKLHACQHCSATFCSPYHLRRHEYTHTGERPYWCGECNIGFIQKYRYRNHRMTHHGEDQASKYKDPSRMCKKPQQQMDYGTAATSEPSSKADERLDLTDSDPEGVRKILGE